ncbi:MAG: sigma-70 family RNA polymerase sigma factor [Clostridiales bacterium]|nr:sigma-70 family RNA polymerase sigma factor [Clostridiales bacterium]MCD8133889.1 sigma-70 family RNA polymerase sigma factor [Clostridiales bacterium]
MERYEKMTDAELIRLLRDGESRVMDYLLEKYKYLVRKKANALFLLGGDTDDLIQEGMIGLFKAVRDYDEDAGSFFHFAELCISRQIYTAIESAARKKHGPLNSYISLSSGSTDEGNVPIGGAVAANDQNPEQMMIDRENLDDFLSRIYDRLSVMEQRVMDYYLEGMNYRQIAEAMGMQEKSVDNALQRIRGKVQRISPSDR